MAWHSFLNISTILLVFMFILPAQLNAYYTQNTGCHHNGTWYADKSLVPTTEKCLNCQCNKKTLVCRLKVCPEMPMPPPRGCVVVEKKNTCCPYLSCARLDAFYAKIPATRRIIAYLDHYERESIDRVVNENMLQRRSDDTDVDLYVCVKNGTVYKSGSAMSSSNLCSYCYCIGGTEKCVKPKCMLPVGGCKPIFVDSTCCPVRYDCSVKQTGKSSQEQRYRKTSNKHYLRMSQRLQRNRGCQMGQQFYVEGQKMKSDPDKPCDVCFCIRGQRKCAPKKCSPSLRNCIPVVPKGQCCPSSYDCGSQRDYRRAQNSRQFNLYSLLFGKDEEGQEDNAATEISVEYPHDREPLGSMQSATAALQHNNHGVMSPSTEKSIFDTIREGLEFIDSNNAPVLNNNLDLGSPKPSPKPIPLMAYNYMVPEHSTTTEVSFLDLLLGPTDNSTKTAETNKDETTSAEEPEEKTTNTAISWVDLILGPDEEDLKASASDTISDKLDAGTSTLVQDHTDFTTTIDRMDNEVAESQHTLGELTIYDQEKLFTSTHDDEEQTTEAITTEDTTLPTTMADTTDAVSSTQKQETTERTTEPTKKPTSKPEKLTGSTKSKPQKTTKQPNSIHSTQASSPTNSTSTKPTKKTSDFKPLPDVKKVQKTENFILKETKSPNKTMNASKPANNSDFLAALIDGLSDILNKEQTAQNGTAQINQTVEKIKTATLKLPTPKPLPLFKPLPVDKTYTRINSKIANLTLKQTVISNNKEHVNKTFRPMPPLVHPKIPIIPIKEDLVTSTVYNEPKSNQTLAAAASTASTAAATTSHATTSARSSTGVDSIEVTHSSTTLKPVVIESNPSILEAEPIEAEPTLPPSLPNLKIIPFLPTDALNAEPSSSYDYYHHPHVTGPISRIDYDIYDDDANVYPSITEKYPMYPDMEDASKAEYIYKFNIEGPDSVVPGTAGKFDESFNMKYDFPAASMRQVPKGFSPPTKTEGGFVPKEPLHLDADNVDRLGEDGSEEEIRPSGSSQVASVAGVASVTNVAVGSVADADHDVSVKVGDSYQVTQHIIEITTPADVINTTKLIEITTPDPFKNVIRTEPPPDLTSLIEDKLKNKLIASMDATLAPASEAAQAKYSEHGAAGAALPATMEINVTSLISKESNLQLEDIETKEIVKSNVDDKNLAKIIKKTETVTPHVSDHQNHEEDDDDDDADAIDNHKDNNEQIDLGNNKKKAGTEADHNQPMNITNDMINATIPPFKTLPAAIMKHFDKETATTTTVTNIRETSTPATTKSFNRPTTFTRTTTTTPLNATINGSGNTKYASKYKPIQNHNIKNKPNFLAQSSSSTTTSSQLALTTFSAKNRTLPKTYARTTVKPTRNRVVISTTPRIKLQYKPKKNSTRTVNSPVSALKSTSASSLSSSSQVATSTTSPATSASAVNLKLKYNANRRLPSPKPGKYNKATNRPITTTTTTTATVSDISPITTATTRKNILKAAKPINIEISSEASQEQEEDESEQEDDEEEEEQHTTMTTTTTTIKITKAPTTTSTTTTRTTLTTPSTTSSQEPLRQHQQQQQQQQHQQSTTQNPFLMSPFDKLPFMNASFEVKRNSATQSSQSEPTIQWPSSSSSSSDSMTQPQYFDGHQYHPQHNIGTNGLMQYTHMVNQFNGLSEETSRQPIELSTSASSTTSSSSSSSSTATQSTNLVQTSPSTSTFSTTSSNNLMDPIGLLKLAGCNIYGRMYRVGRIILELSSPCLECKCTEIGVKCGPLEC